MNFSRPNNWRIEKKISTSIINFKFFPQLCDHQESFESSRRVERTNFPRLENPCKLRKLSEPSLSPRRLSVSETRCGFRPRYSRSEHTLPLPLFSYEKWSEHRTTFTYGSYEPKLRDASRKILKGDPRGAA